MNNEAVKGMVIFRREEGAMIRKDTGRAFGVPIWVVVTQVFFSLIYQAANLCLMHVFLNVLYFTI